MSENTEDLEARIAAYIDGQLPPAEAARLEVFLANTDPRLAEQIIGMLNDRHRLRTLPRPAAPIDLAARVMEQVERATLLNDTNLPDHHAPHRWWQSKAAIAAGIFLMVGGFSYLVAVAVIGGGSQTRETRIVTNSPTDARKEVGPFPIPAPVTSLPSVMAPESRGLEGATLSRAGEDKDHDREALLRSSGAGPTGGAAGKMGGGMGGAGEFAGGGPAPHGPVAMKDSSDPALRVAGEKEIDKAEKTEEVVKEQLDRNRQVVQNGQVFASKHGYAEVASPLRALANISSSSSPSSPEPVIVTLVARDERDFARLRIALEELLNQDSAAAAAQVALGNRYRYNITNITRRNALNNNGDMNFNNQAQAQRQVTDALKPANGTVGNTTVANGESNGNFQFWDPGQRDFGAVIDGNTLARADGSPVQANAAATNIASAPGASAASPAPAEKQDLAVAKDAASAPAGRAQPQAPNYTPAPNYAQAQTLDNTTQRRQQALQNFDAGPLYRVALRQDQLVQLANQFRVDSITCGRQSYRITSETYDYQLAKAKDRVADEPADKTEKQIARGGAKKTYDLNEEPFGPPPPQAPAAVVPAAPAASAAPATMKVTGQRAVAEKAKQSEQKTGSDGNQESQARQENASDIKASNLKSPAFIECIITMEQPPAQTTRPTSTDAAQPLTK